MLETLFNPKAIAVIGASRDPQKVGHAVLKNLIRFNYAGRIFPINPSAGEIEGIKTFPSVSAIREKIDLAVVTVPSHSVPDVLKDCAKADINTVVIISSGFKESGTEGMKLEKKIKEISAEHGIRMLGPNCLGVINTLNNMNATFSAGMLPSGRIAFFSQSGALGIAILDWAIGNKIGFSKFISLGNKTDLNETDFIEYFVNDSETDVILGYIEDVIDGKKFLDTAKRAAKVKPIILLKSGGSEAGARAASSHTGALAGSDKAFNAAFKQSGIIRAESLQELFDSAIVFSAGKFPKGNRLLIITNAGGPGIIAADTAERLGLKLTYMTKESIDQIVKLLPSNASLYNPIDLIGDASSERYDIVLERAVKDSEVDGILAILTPQAMINVKDTAEIIINKTKQTDRPIITSFMGDISIREGAEKLKDNSVPNFLYPEAAVNAYKELCDYSEWKNLEEEHMYKSTINRDYVKQQIDSILKEGRFKAGEEDAVKILASYGFVFPERALARTSKEAANIASKIGFPVVMKISSPDILHKTEVGGVKLNINSKEAASDTFTELTTNASRLMHDAYIKGVMIYKMIEKGREVILGITYDKTFGHMVMFGLGGIYVEVLKDISFRILPITRRDALSMVNEIKTGVLLKGVRGEKPADMDAIIEGILRLSDIAADFPVIHELDINPLVVMEKGAVALDARIIFEHP
ncbi:MAG: acetate--CoA ligase family protein [Nitrospiraceae bacterium]|nr:acetate--CoA ligase family protein [Nitrospiraceae bacterium]